MKFAPLIRGSWQKGSILPDYFVSFEDGKALLVVFRGIQPASFNEIFILIQRYLMADFKCCPGQETALPIKDINTILPARLQLLICFDKKPSLVIREKEVKSREMGVELLAFPGNSWRQSLKVFGFVFVCHRERRMFLLYPFDQLALAVDDVEFVF